MSGAISFERVAFVGGGNMAGALIGGLRRRGVGAERIVVADPSEVARERLAREFGIATTGDNDAAAAGADVLVLAVKPQRLREVLLPLAPGLRRPTPPLVLSIAAGIPHATLRRWCGPGVPIVRSMPNQPALAGCGATGLYAPGDLDAEVRARAEAIMAAVGTTVWVEREELMDVVTALSGSGPAYFFRFMELLEAAAIAQGLPPEVARTLTLETAFGAAQLARTAGESLETLRARVTSPGGTTAAALGALEAGGFGRLIDAAIDAAVKRSAELARAADEP